MTKRPIEIDCVEVWRNVSDYLDEEVDAQLRAVMSAHFRNCAHCSAVLDGTRNVLKLVGDGKSFELPRDSSRRFYSKLDRYLATKKPKNGRRQ